MADVAMSPTPDVTAAATPATEPASFSNGTAETVGGDANAQGAPAEENLGRVDPKTLPPELRSIHDNMLRDYKDKTSKVAEERKSFESFRQKAEAYEQLLQDQNIQAYLNKVNQPATEEPQGPAVPTPEEWAMATQDPTGMKLQELVTRQVAAEKAELETKQAIIQQDILRRDAKDSIDAFAEAKDTEGKALRPDFYELVDNGLIPMFVERMDPKDRKDMGKAIESAYTRAKEITERYYAKGKQEALSIVQQKAAQSTERPSVTPGDVSKVESPEKITVQEAFAAAKKGRKLH